MSYSKAKDVTLGFGRPYLFIKQNIIHSADSRTLASMERTSWTKPYALKSVENSPLNLAELPLLFQNDRDVVRAAVRKMGYALRHARCGCFEEVTLLTRLPAHPYLTKPTCIFSFIISFHLPLALLSPEIRSDRGVVAVACLKWPKALQFATDEVRSALE